MTGVVRKDDEPIEQLLRRFEKRVRKEAIMFECKRRRFYVKPGERRRSKHNAATRRRSK